MSEIAIRPPQKRATRTRNQLIDAAIQSFARAGYDGSSTRQIETNAGVKRGVIAYHFSTKEELWKAAIARMLDLAESEFSEVERVAANIDPAARLRYFVRVYVRFAAHYPDIFRFMIREGMDNDWRLEWLIESAARPWYLRLRKMFEEAQALGDTLTMEFAHFYYILTGAGALIFAMAPEVKQLSGIDSKDESVVDAHANILAELLFPTKS